MFKGYSSSRKPDGSEVAFATVEPIRTEQHGLSVLAHSSVREVGLDAAEAGSIAGLIVATAHSALKGDVINITSGALAGRETKVASVTANGISIVDNIALGTGDTFQILRHKYPILNADGTISASLAPAPILFNRDGVDTEVSQDTAVPANSRPLPAKVLDNAGVEVALATSTLQTSANTKLDTLIAKDFATTAKQDLAKAVLDSLLAEATTLNGKDFATQTTLAAILSELGQKTEPTDTQPISAVALPLPTGAATAALQGTGNTSLGSIDGKLATLGQKAMAGSMPVAIASDQGALTVSDPEQTATGNITTQNLNPATGTATANSTVALASNGASAVTVQVTGTYTGILTPQITVDGTNWIALAATATTNINTNAQAATIASAAQGIFKIAIPTCAQFRLSANAAVTGTAVVTLRASRASVTTALAQPLPAGAAVIGALTANQSVNNAQVNGVTFLTGNGVTGTGSLRVTVASDNTSFGIRNQDGAGNLLTSTLLGALRGLHTVGLGNAFADSARLATGTVTSGAWTQLIASTAAEAQGITIFDSSGQSLELGFGPAASEARRLIIPPGGLNGFIPLRIPAGTRLSVRALGTTADYTSSQLLLTLLG